MRKLLKLLNKEEDSVDQKLEQSYKDENQKLEQAYQDEIEKLKQINSTAEVNH